ncbi:MAG: DUF4416 family protein [Syntrophorhabdaceae bacterium]|nr:DUF4416 family protein [Syntrophorhabdaceae bacterium]MDD4195909.1 DUF4416 family protein [Syntrophorhabdaceae bacterium]HOC46293.1 DUF4416 family protein [Syntrophorhabdaceae bacterium]
MGKIKRPDRVKLFASLIFHEDVDLGAVFGKLNRLIGPAEDETGPALFTHTTYYDAEMGQGLKRCFVLFGPVFDRDILPDIKLATNEIEDLFAQNNKRTVNIDAGYIALEHVILATTKGYAHRLYIGKGIHADLTLMFNNGSYRALQWTYPDYAEPETIALFNKWRESVKLALRGSRQRP